MLRAGAAALAVFGFLLLAKATPASALLLALFGAVLTARWSMLCPSWTRRP